MIYSNLNAFQKRLIKVGVKSQIRDIADQMDVDRNFHGSIEDLKSLLEFVDSWNKSEGREQRV